MPNIKSQMKRVKTNEKSRQRNKAVKSALRTYVRNFRRAAEAGDVEAAAKAARVANLSLIHISEPTRPVCSSRMPSSA